MPPLDEYLSNSRSWAFNKCRQFYSLKYVDKVRPHVREQHIDSWTRLFRGVAIHAGIESGLLGEAPDKGVAEVVAEQRSKGLNVDQEAALVIIADESPQIATALLEWLPASDWEPMLHQGKPMVEQRLECALPGWKGFLGYADLVALHKPSGLKFVLDWKSKDRFGDDNSDQYNMQFLLYQYALMQLGRPVDGSLLVELKPTVPKGKPRKIRIDDGGVFSVRVSIDGRFRSTPTLRSQQFIEAGWRDFVKQAQVIANLQQRDVYRSMSPFNCVGCEMQRICMGELAGSDVASIVKHGYTVPDDATIIMN